MISSPFKKAAKSARRITALALLSVFATACVAVYAAAAKPDWTIAPTPSSATVTKGGQAQFTVQLTRVNGFTGSVALSTGPLPAGVTATFTPTTIPATSVSTQTNSAQLKLTTTTATPVGNHTIFLIGRNGNTTKYSAVTLVVQDAATQNFSIEVSPPIQYIAQNDGTRFNVKVVRTNGFSGAVTLSTYELPDKVSGIFTPAGPADEYYLDLHSDHNAQPGSYSFAVLGRGTLNGSEVTRFGAVALNVETTKAIGITGGIVGNPLVPGAIRAVDPSLTNPHKFAVRLGELSVSVRETTSSRSCSGGSNFEITQMQEARFRPTGQVPAMTIPAQTTLQLSAIPGVVAADLPTIKMRNLANDQDACKNTQIHFEYVGSVRK